MYNLGEWAIAFALGGMLALFLAFCFFMSCFEDKCKTKQANRRFAFKCLPVAIVLGSISGFLMYTDNVQKETQKKQYQIAQENLPENQLRKITDMQDQLRNQIQTIADTQNKYRSDMEILSGEIRKEKEQKHISSLDQAPERMKYNIQLIQEMDAYYSELTKLRKVTESGLEEAIYVERRLNAKNLMAKAIGDGKILSQEVDGLLKKYGPALNQYVIDPKKLTMKSTEEIWQQIGK